MKFHPRINDPCLWWNISDYLHSFFEMKFNPEMNSSLPKRQGWNFILGWKKEKKDAQRYNPGIEFYNEHVFTWFLAHILNILSNFNMFEHNEYQKKDFIEHFYDNWSPKNHYHFFVKFGKAWNFPHCYPCCKVLCIVLNARNETYFLFDCSV